MQYKFSHNFRSPFWTFRCEDITKSSWIHQESKKQTLKGGWGPLEKGIAGHMGCAVCTCYMWMLCFCKKSLSIFANLGLSCSRGSWNQSPTNTEGWLWLVIVSTENLNLCWCVFGNRILLETEYTSSLFVSSNSMWNNHRLRSLLLMVLKPVKSPICFLVSVLSLTFFLKI